MSILQIRIDDKIILDKLKALSKSKGLSLTSFARMRLYEEAENVNQNIEAGLLDLREGKVSPNFTNTDDAIDWLKK